MNKNPIVKAFDNLISAINQYIDNLKKESIKAIQIDNPDRAQELFPIIKKAIEYRTHIEDHYTEWKNNIGKPSHLDVQTERFLELISSPNKSEPHTPKPKLSSQRRFPNLNISNSQINVIPLDEDNFGDIYYTKIVRGKIGDISVENVGWREFVNCGIIYAQQTGLSFEDLCHVSALNIKEGEYRDHGFLPVSGTGISVQNMASDRAAKSLIRLSRHLKCNLDIVIEWASNEKARYPGQLGHIECKAALDKNL